MRNWARIEILQGRKMDIVMDNPVSTCETT
jgi:hypothetical protein